MNRRKLIVLLGGAAVWPRTAYAQQKAMPVIGFLNSRSSDEAVGVATAFRQGLTETGFDEGRNLAIEYRWAEGHYDRLPVLAADLVERKVDLMAAVGGPPSARAAKNSTSTIPIVFVTGDPVGEGLIANLARPGGNVTGLSVLAVELTAKRFELLCELVPQARVIAILVNPKSAISGRMIHDVEDAARAKGMQLQFLKASTESEIDSVLAAQLRADALAVCVDPYFDSRRDQIVTLVARHAIPAIYWLRDYAAEGGLISYGPSLAEAYRQAGIYAGRILRGEKPADLPVQQPDKFEMVINLKTAKTLGLTVPQLLLAQADEVIE